MHRFVEFLSADLKAENGMRTFELIYRAETVAQTQRNKFMIAWGDG